MSSASPQLSVGVLTADLTRLGDELRILQGTGCWAHVDVMDGAFCPQLTVGPEFVAAVASGGLTVDAHLMVEEPIRILPDIVAAGASVVTVHAESTRHLYRTLLELTALADDQDREVLRGVGINPSTPVHAIEPVLELVDLVLILAVDPGWPGQPPAASVRRRVDAVRALAAGLGSAPRVGVDGGVTMANAAEIAGWGVDVIVSGRAIYDGSDPAGNLRRMLDRLCSAPARSRLDVMASSGGTMAATTTRNQIVVPPTPMKITQIAVVVRDIEAALKSYTETLGWGPWSVFDYKPPLLHDTRVKGEPVEFRMIGAEASVDGLGFELIQPVSGPSIYQEFLDAHGEGVQHIACMKHSVEDSSLVQQHWRANGAGVLMSGRIGESIEFYYLDTAPMLKFVLESGSGHAIDLKPTYIYP